MDASMDQADLPEIAHHSARFADGLMLDCGVRLPALTVAYRTYGTLNALHSNAILVCHALTGDQYVGERHPVTGRGPWWDEMVGPGKPVDTERYFVICANVLGGCMGSTGPQDPRAPGEAPWGPDFPPITIRDMVRAQKRLIDHLGIARLFAVIGGSMGGMQVLEWAATYPHSVFAAVPIATAAHHSAQNIAFNEVGRQAIFTDPDYAGGQYYATGRFPSGGLGVARMVAHITYLSEQALSRKFGRKLQGVASSAAPLALFSDMFQVESYLQHQGSTFVRRFDANSYLTITRAMDYFDIAAEHDGDLSRAFEGTRTRFCIVSFSSDWLFPTAESRGVARALNRAAANVSFVEVESDKGHDAFLLDEPDLRSIVGGFLTGCAVHAGLDA
jgi:homoserine O-acetyltransferase